ncbi:MAG: MFS transporter [Actinobacteria bacterium]|nr:MFS transporter [Actinomycetota bacterium]
MPIRHSFEVLREPGFRRLFVGRTASLIGDGLAPVALAFAVLDLTGSATDLGLVLAAHSLVMTALVLVGGVYADRLSPRLAMLGADLVRVVSTGLIAVLLLTGAAAIWQLVVLYAVAGAATAFFNPASDSLVPQLVPASRLRDGYALLNFSRSAGRFAGPALAGVVLAIGSPGDALAIDAATFAISAACLLRVHAPRPPRPAVATSFLTDLRGGWSEFASRTWLWSIVVAAAVSNAVCFPAFQVLGPTVAKAELGGSSAWALIAASMGLGAVLGALLSLLVRPRRPLLAGEGFLVALALPIALLALPAATAAIALGALVSGIAGTFASVLWESTWVQHVPAAARSRVSAYDWFGSLALEPLGLALVGPLAAGIGTSTTLWLCAVVVLGCQVATLSIPSVRRLRAGPGAAPVPIAMPPPVEAGD